jgi:hypothetical protein
MDRDHLRTEVVRRLDVLGLLRRETDELREQVYAALGTSG